MLPVSVCAPKKQVGVEQNRGHNPPQPWWSMYPPHCAVWPSPEVKRGGKQPTGLLTRVKTVVSVSPPTVLTSKGHSRLLHESFVLPVD